MYNLEGRVALVTGASRPRGIGRAIALRLAREGANVVVADLPAPFADFPDYGVGSVEQAAVAEEIRRLGRQALALPVDVTDSELVQQMVERVLETFGRLDILVNNAGGVVGPAPVVEKEEAAWRKTLDINATGTFLCSRAVAAHMIQRGEGGKIINISSAAAKAGAPWLSAYCAAKAGHHRLHPGAGLRAGSLSDQRERRVPRRRGHRPAALGLAVGGPSAWHPLRRGAPGSR